MKQAIIDLFEKVKAMEIKLEEAVQQFDEMINQTGL